MILQTKQQAAPLLLAGKIGVIPTDTVYGVVARASDESAVERLYKARGRSVDKACIVLVAGLHQITDTSQWTKTHFALAQKYWPGALSLLAPITDKTPFYLHRGTGGLVYRVPDLPDLQQLLEVTGPLIAPSANPEGQQIAETIAQAKTYFDGVVDFYVKGGTISDVPASTIAKIHNGTLKIIRQGAVIVEL